MFNLLRRYKSYRRWMEFSIGDVVIDCRGHPCMISAKNDFLSIDVLSLADRTPNSCSLFACGIYKPTPEEVMKKLYMYETYGQVGIMLVDNDPRDNRFWVWFQTTWGREE